MIIFNILPIFPLDGYRIISDLIPNNILIEEIFLYFSFFILVVLIIIFYSLKIYGFILICLYLFKLTFDKFKQIKIKQNVINTQIKYQLNKYLKQGIKP